eukprot:Awhi_evm3s2734
MYLLFITLNITAIPVTTTTASVITATTTTSTATTTATATTTTASATTAFTTTSSEIPLIKVIVDVVYNLPNYSTMTQTRQDLIKQYIRDICIQSGIKDETIKEIIILERESSRRRDSDSVNVRIIFEDRLTAENVATIVEEGEESAITVGDE